MRLRRWHVPLLALADARFARYRRLRAEIRSPNMMCIVPGKPGAIYTEIPKAGSTTIKQLFWEQLRERFEPFGIAPTPEGTPRLPTIRQFGVRPFYDLVDDSDTLVFTFVRNPFTRLVSCYRNKFESHPIATDGGCNGDAHKFFAGRLSALPGDEPLPFSWFVDMACEEVNNAKNYHWLAMSRLISSEVLPCHFVGRVETYDQDIETVCSHLGISNPGKRFNVTGSVALSEWITPDMRCSIARAYHEDFERFGYSTALPAD